MTVLGKTADSCAGGIQAGRRSQKEASIVALLFLEASMAGPLQVTVELMPEIDSEAKGEMQPPPWAASTRSCRS